MYIIIIIFSVCPRTAQLLPEGMAAHHAVTPCSNPARFGHYTSSGSVRARCRPGREDEPLLYAHASPFTDT